MPFKQILITIIFTAVTYGQHYSRLSGWCQQGNKTITVAGNTSSTNTPVQRSFPRCTVNVYAAGTTNASSLFSTATGTPLSNPISGDVNGFYAFFIADGNYDLAFSGGTPGAIPVPFTLGSQPSNDPFYESSLSGYVARLKNAKLSDVLSVKDYGAVGDGTTDDTTAVTAALNASSIGTTTTGVVTPGVCIYFPTGVYKITSALSISHAICATGEQWRLRYLGSNSITAVLSLIGDPTNTYGSHGTFFQGSFIQGAIIDGGTTSKAGIGLILQGVVSAQINYLRVTNVTGTGVSCNWCQQTTFERLQVSSDYEPFTVTPTNGIIIDNISSANILHQVNIDHVTGDGIWLRYALNTYIAGGTSEGVGGWGVRCDGAASGPFRQCFNNTLLQFDVEANTSGDILFGTSSFFNSVIQANSSSTVGIQFTGDSHYNTIIGGAVGVSSATSGTYSNWLINAGSFSLTDPVWTDNGSNGNTTIRNQSTGIVTEPRDNTSKSHTFAPLATAPETILFRNPTVDHTGIIVGNTSANWIGWDCQTGFPSCWFIYPATGGMQFISETSLDTGAVNDGAIKNHKWCFGTFCQTPLIKFDFFDGVATTVGIRAGSGQGGANLLETYDYDSGGGTGSLLSGIDSAGRWFGPLGGNTVVSAGSTGHALCKNAASKISNCTSVVASDGTCTCP